MLTVKEKVCDDLRIFISACGPTAIRAGRAEEIVRGKELTAEVIEKAGAEASWETRPITDVRASADYRSKMVAVLTRRALRQAHQRALER